ncbi:Bug family tripartite tricarboxylate transporter substrate binding protein [Hydrogenophaga palleronii]|uniref:Bug family tripartite tricarboxylate transporter substrate binding protein n=1 Tax=Hydrogenophaga palleronii TaxID=65655 RepID=UPI000824C532|nr:tripartite tricarboxylate transporter substrate-binding protein [Hydrogenophaga palleronii]
MQTRRVLLCAALAALSAANATAQTTDWPHKPVRIIVPFAPGGGIDVLTRSVMTELSTRWKQPVVIENRAGAGSLIGAEAVAKAAPDGYTLLATVNQTLVSNRFLYRSLPYDPDKSFEPITLMVNSDQMVIASSTFPGNTLKDVVEAARRQPGGLTYGSFGNGSQPHLLFETIGARESVKLLHVPYKGVTPMLTALAGGEVMLGTGSAAVAGPLIAAGKIKPIAVAGASRMVQYGQTATSTEQGYPYVKTSIWYGLFAPAGMPAAVIAKIHADVRSVLTDPSFAEKQVTAKGLTVVAGDAAQLRRVIQDESRLTAEQVKAAGVTLE